MAVTLPGRREGSLGPPATAPGQLVALHSSHWHFLNANHVLGATSEVGRAREQGTGGADPPWRPSPEGSGDHSGGRGP